MIYQQTPDRFEADLRQAESRIDEADAGMNPLGLANGVVPFDIDPSQVDAGKTHFEQIFERTLTAFDNAVGAWDYANGEAGEGRAYVYFGSATGLSLIPDWTHEIDQASGNERDYDRLMLDTQWKWK